MSFKKFHLDEAIVPKINLTHKNPEFFVQMKSKTFTHVFWMNFRQDLNKANEHL